MISAKCEGAERAEENAEIGLEDGRYGLSIRRVNADEQAAVDLRGGERDFHRLKGIHHGTRQLGRSGVLGPVPQIRTVQTVKDRGVLSSLVWATVGISV